MREIIYPKQNDEMINYADRLTNQQNRAKNCIPTIHSQLQKEKICDIYRWRTTLAPAYLNNKQEMETELRVWEYNWYRMKNIMIKYKQDHDLGTNEIQLLGDYQSFTNPKRWNAILTRIHDKEPPRTNSEFRKISYPLFKELAKPVLRYQTYHPGKYENKSNHIPQCPTCNRVCNGKSQLTKHRKILYNADNMGKKYTNTNNAQT